MCLKVTGTPVRTCWSFGSRNDFKYGVATVSRIDKLYVSFAEYCLFYRALLQKKPIILSILLTVATPYDLLCM